MAEVIHHFIAEVHMDPEDVRYWTGIGELTLPDGTYTGLPFVAISSTEERRQNLANPTLEVLRSAIELPNNRWCVDFRY